MAHMVRTIFNMKSNNTNSNLDIIIFIFLHHKIKTSLTVCEFNCFVPKAKTMNIEKKKTKTIEVYTSNLNVL